MQGKKIKQVNNIVITQVSPSGFVAWNPDGEIIEVARDVEALYNFCATQSKYLYKAGYQKKLNVLVDVDATLVNFHRALQRRLAERGITYYPDRLTEYHGIGMTPDIIGCDWNIVRAAMQYPPTYDTNILRLYNGVDAALEKLRTFATTNAYTGAENVKEIYLRRLDFCKDHKLLPTNVTIGSKQVLGGYDVLFDDNPYVIDRWVKSATPTKIFMISQPYNIHMDLNTLGWSHKVVRCKDFPDAVNKCYRLYNR